MKCGVLGILVGVRMGQNWWRGSRAMPESSQAQQRSSPKHLPKGLSRIKLWQAENRALGMCSEEFGAQPQSFS